MSKKVKSSHEHFVRKRAQLLSRAALILGCDESEAVRVLRQRSRQSFRLRGDAAVLDELTALGWRGEQRAWYPAGYRIEGDKRIVSDSAAANRGVIYAQNAASWLPPLVLDPKPSERVLDVCAAPGGKAAHAYDLSGGECELWVNDNSRPRLAKLRANFARLGISEYHETMYDAARLSRFLEHESFDKILLDVPCSGEGMMDVDDPADFTYWSIAQIKRLSARQKQLLREAWRLLRPGGLLVYSTCTMAPEENEEVVSYALAHLDNCHIEPLTVSPPGRMAALTSWGDKRFRDEVSLTCRLRPTVEAEAFFVAALRKQV